MTTTTPITEDHQDYDPDDSVARLINLAGPRPSIPADLERRVYDQTRSEWDKSVRGQNLLRWAVPLALAASVLLAVVMRIDTSGIQPIPVGTVVFVADANVSASIGDVLNIGQVLDTAPGSGMSIDLKNAVSLRVAENSKLKFDAIDEITLLSGKLYVDSGNSFYSNDPITVHTLRGSATDIGTQFAVMFDGEVMGVAVREGRVDISGAVGDHSAIAGDKLTMRPDQTVDKEELAANDASWNWAVSLAPGFDIENQSALNFLKWVSRETGKQLEFSSNDARMAAMKAKLHGDISGLTPEQALASVLPTTRFSYSINDSYITISD